MAGPARDGTDAFQRAIIDPAHHPFHAPGKVKRWLRRVSKVNLGMTMTALDTECSIDIIRSRMAAQVCACGPAVNLQNMEATPIENARVRKRAAYLSDCVREVMVSAGPRARVWWRRLRSTSLSPSLGHRLWL